MTRSSRGVLLGPLLGRFRLQAQRVQSLPVREGKLGLQKVVDLAMPLYRRDALERIRYDRDREVCHQNQCPPHRHIPERTRLARSAIDGPHGRVVGVLARVITDLQDGRAELLRYLPVSSDRGRRRAGSPARGWHSLSGPRGLS